MVNPDLTSVGIACGFRGLTNFTDGIVCYMENGFSEPCARTWMYDTLYTSSKCGQICTSHVVNKSPNNLAPPTCYLSPCIQCDEDESGPNFKKFAGRTRRDSGLLSAIVRNCSSLVQFRQRDPCDMTPLTVPPVAAPVNNGSILPTKKKNNSPTVSPSSSANKAAGTNHPLSFVLLPMAISTLVIDWLQLN